MRTTHSNNCALSPYDAGAPTKFSPGVAEDTILRVRKLCAVIDERFHKEYGIHNPSSVSISRRDGRTSRYPLPVQEHPSLTCLSSKSCRSLCDAAIDRGDTTPGYRDSFWKVCTSC